MDFGNAAQIASAAVAILAMVISIVSARSKGIKDAIDALRAMSANKADKTETADLFTRMRHVETQVTDLKNDVEHLPDKDVSHRMEMAIARLEGRFEAMDERLKPVAAMASRMQEFMLERHDK